MGSVGAHSAIAFRGFKLNRKGMNLVQFRVRYVSCDFSTWVRFVSMFFYPLSSYLAVSDKNSNDI